VDKIAPTMDYSKTFSLPRLRTAPWVLGAAALTLLSTLAASPARADGELTESDFLDRVRRLTFEGKRAGEGYFSPSGDKMVFQSERDPENPFYQIFLLDMTTGDIERVSNGVGKTTCAFIRPGSSEVLYGSTHHDPRSKELQQAELDFRASGQERRYSWDYDPEMDIWVTDTKTGTSKRLTETKGYDAEGAYSPDGQWIVYSSTRSAFNRELTPEQEKLLEVDPAFFGELHIMRADGSDDKRLTHVDGYDGGPFFFPDGERIVWRRFREDGLTADVYSMKTDGTDVKRITNFGAMSWAPYVHPSGEYILFASNKLGFSNFEVFIVDVEGLKEPVQVTYTDGFDGLPVPTPDGKQLTWTSSGRHDGDGGQIYIAKWNHANALKALAAAPKRTENDE
ncbi:MAG: peptidase M28, partial [Acidobacteriota bacterium]